LYIWDLTDALYIGDLTDALYIGDLTDAFWECCLLTCNHCEMKINIVLLIEGTLY
jgi:hypothetical protein